MISWIQPPRSSQIAKYVECYWLIEKQPDSDSHAFPKLNPESNAHFIISPSNQPYHYQAKSALLDGLGSHWLFPYRETLQLDHSKPFVHLGIKFKIGALYSLEVPGCAHPQLDNVYAQSLQALLNHCQMTDDAMIHLALNNPEECGKMLDQALLPWVNKASEDKHSELTRKVLPLLADRPISELGEALFCSQRTLERSFSRVTGLTLKQCHTMQKLEAMLEYLYQRDLKDIDWVEVAYLFGFSDQPHLIRHLKKQIGLTPQNYAKQRDFTIDVYGGVETQSLARHHSSDK